MKLSIIVPVFNTRGYLPLCLDSVIYPNLKDYEVIIVNDGSTDDSLSIIEQYERKYPDIIRSVTKENGGIGSARNVGIEIAKGEYVQFLDSDDRLSPDAVPEMLDAIESGYDIYIFDLWSVNEKGAVIETLSGCRKTGAVNLRDFPELLLEYPSGGNKIIRRSLFTDNSISFPFPMWYEDLRTIPKLYLHTDKIFAVHKPWYIYLLRQGSITNSSKLVRNLEITDAVNDVLDYYTSQGKYELFKPQLDYLCFYNQFLTASVRVCSVDPTSEVAVQLRKDFLSCHPDYRKNPYYVSASLKHKLLSFLFMNNMRRSAAFLMRLNGKIKGKSF